MAFINDQNKLLCKGFWSLVLWIFTICMHSLYATDLKEYPKITFLSKDVSPVYECSTKKVKNAYVANLTHVKGLVHGTVFSIDAEAWENGYKSTIVLESDMILQTFQSFTRPAPGGEAIYTSTHDPHSSFALTYATSISAISDLESFKSTLELAIMRYGLGCTFTTSSSAAHDTLNGFRPISAIKATSLTPAKLYFLSQIPGGDKMHISSINYSEDVPVSASGSQTINFKGCGISVDTDARYSPYTAFFGVAFWVSYSSTNIWESHS